MTAYTAKFCRQPHSAVFRAVPVPFFPVVASGRSSALASRESAEHPGLSGAASRARSAYGPHRRAVVRMGGPLLGSLEVTRDKIQNSSCRDSLPKMAPRSRMLDHCPRLAGRTHSRRGCGSTGRVGLGVLHRDICLLDSGVPDWARASKPGKAPRGSFLEMAFCPWWGLRV